MESVAFQGERGAYSEEAALEIFPGARAVAFASFAEAAAAAESGECERAVLPVENVLAGSVGEAYDVLSTAGVSIVGEAYHRIRHCLIGTGTLESVRTVYSHPQALGQCAHFIGEHSLRAVPTWDTAGSVAMVAGKGAEAACIASAAAARLHGVPVIREAIADDPDNHTRFVVLAARGASSSGGGKTSVIASIRHERGALCSLLGAFEAGGANLTKIESRPRRKSRWEYDFYIDFECDAARTDGVLASVRKRSVQLRVLGTYEAAPRP